MIDPNAEPTIRILTKLNRYVDADALTPSQAAWRFVESLESNYRFRDQTELLETPLFVQKLNSEIVNALKDICLTSDSQVYIRSVCADPPGPHVVQVDVDRNVTPTRIVLNYSDGETAEVLPADPQRIVIETVRAVFGIASNVG